MKEIKLDDAEKGDELAIYLPDDLEPIRGTYDGMLFDMESKEWYFEIVTPFGYVVGVPTGGWKLIFRTRKAPKKPQPGASEESLQHKASQRGEA